MDHPIVDYMRGMYPECSQLMSYYLPTNEVWSIGYWLNTDLGEVKEVISLRRDEQPTRDHIDTILFNLQPDRVNKGVRRWLDKQNAKKRELTAEQMASQEKYYANRRRAISSGKMNKEDPRRHTIDWALLP